ncbi:MAG: high-potential iron-sulfur protein [Polyangiaceae bacterium]
MRKTLDYSDASADPAKTCANCQLYKPAAPDQCGSCTLLKGTIHPKGFCKSWAAKTT